MDGAKALVVGANLYWAALQANRLNASQVLQLPMQLTALKTAPNGSPRARLLPQTIQAIPSLAGIVMV
jgi:hypothetical protein